MFKVQIYQSKIFKLQESQKFLFLHFDHAFLKKIQLLPHYFSFFGTLYLNLSILSANKIFSLAEIKNSNLEINFEIFLFPHQSSRK